ncbi:MAG: AgmX/PglI C-terminal domain-containing protein [Panacagrimonas sp.]
MSLFVLSAEGWDFNEQSDRRFRRTLLTLGFLWLVLAILIPFLDLIGVQEGGGETVDAYVEFLPEAEIAEQVEEPKPAEEDEKPKPEPPVPEKKPEEKKEPAPKAEAPVKPEPTQQELEQAAREVAQQSGINALADQLSDLRDNSLSGLDAARPLSDEVVVARSGSGGSGGSASIAASAASGSGGIGTSTATTPRTQSGAGLGQRRTTVVQAPKGIGPDLTKPGQDGKQRLAGRTLEEIQLVFDRNKASFYSMFNRALRDNPELRGKVVVKLTIAPNGSVTACELVTSELGDPELERKVVQRVLLLNFGAKNVPEFTYPNYPIVFLPT